jgi:cation diffusion facilitator family transporter
MHSHDLSRWTQSHHFTGDLRESERKTGLVVLITGIMMVVEIAGGWWFNSMALLADGWHMATHTLALGIGVYAYRYARQHAHNPSYSFGTGKVHALGSYTSALLLGAVAAGVLIESIGFLMNPREIAYDEALIVAVVGLIVNLASIKLLGHDPDHGHYHHDDHHDHDHGDHAAHGHHHHEHAAHDLSRKAAYAHVVTDAMTSVFAIVALLLAKYVGWSFMDPIVGIVGATIIAIWAYNLLKSTIPQLLDRTPTGDVAAKLRKAIESDGDSQIVDLHLWHIAPGKLAAIVAIVSHETREVEEYKQRLAELDLAHVTIELNRCPGH